MRPMTVLCAGSLAGPFGAVKAAFEAEHPGVTVALDHGGSVSIIKRVTEGGSRADVIASADYALIPEMMIPDHADWYVLFAKNRMVLTYTDESRHADEITAGNWFEMLKRDGVRWGFSDPSSDPCGYRAMMVIWLAGAFEELVCAHSTITVAGDASTIHAAGARSDDTSLFIRPKAGDLIDMLRAGDIDYVWEYRSVAVQNGLRFVEFPEEIDLSSMDFADSYAAVRVETGAGDSVTGSPIVYGVTVPKDAEHPDLALEFVEILIGDAGQEILKRAGQPPIVPAGGYGDIPAGFLGT